MVILRKDRIFIYKKVKGELGYEEIRLKLRIIRKCILESYCYHTCNAGRGSGSGRLHQTESFCQNYPAAVEAGVDELTQVYTFLTARPVYPKGWKSGWKTHYFHALGIVVE